MAPASRTTARDTPGATPPAGDPTIRSVFSARTTTGGTGTRPARTAAGVMAATGVADVASGPATAISAGRPKRSTPRRTTPVETPDLDDVENPEEPDEFSDGSGFEDDPSTPVDPSDGADCSADPEDIVDDEDAIDDATTDEAPPSRAARHAANLKPLSPFMERIYGREPGGRWVLMSFLMVLVASVVVATTPVVPEQVKGADGKLQATGKVLSIWHFGLMRGLVYLVPPIMAVGVSILVARPPERRRSWNRGLFALILVTLLGGGIYIYAVAIACMAWGCWQARKAALDAVGGDVAALRAQMRTRHNGDEVEEPEPSPARPPRPTRRTNASKRT